MADVEALKQKVQSILVDKNLKLEVLKDHIRVPFDSTTVALQVEPWGDHLVVRLHGLLAQYVPISDKLKLWVCEQSGGWIFGHVAYFEREGAAFLEFRHTLLGDFLDPDELYSAVAAVAGSTNELDDKVKELFGGERWIDPHQQPAGAPPSQQPPPAPPQQA